MKWCGYMNMWCSDMDDEDIEMAGCDGECNCCDDCEDAGDKAILVIDMPENCYECCLNNSHFCDVTTDPIEDYMNTEYRPDWCPLQAAPEEELVWEHDSDWERGYNSCLREIMGRTEE